MQSHRWTKHFLSRGISSYCIAQESSKLAEDLKKEQTPHFTVKGGKYFSPTTTRQLRKILTDLEPRAIILHHLKDLWLVVPALQGSEKLIGFARMFLKKHKKKGPLHRYLYGKLHKMIHISENQKTHLIQCLPVNEKKYVFIPNGVNLQKFTPENRSLSLHRELGLETDSLVVGIIGRLDPQKGQLETIKGFKSSCLKNPNVNAHLVIIGNRTEGEYEDYEKTIRLEAEELSDKIHFLGYRSDIPNLMADLDIFVLASYEETFGNVVLESLASGVCTLVTQSGGAQEIISDNSSGLYIQPRSADSIAQKLNELFIAQEKISEFKQKARTRAEEHYDIEKIKDQVINTVET